MPDRDFAGVLVGPEPVYLEVDGLEFLQLRGVEDLVAYDLHAGFGLGVQVTRPGGHAELMGDFVCDQCGEAGAADAARFRVKLLKLARNDNLG